MVSASLGDVLTGVFKRDATLTGRTVLWADVLAMGMEHPLRGHGFGAFWYVEEGLEHASWYKHDWRPGDAHNGFVDVFLDMGFVGFTLLMLIIFRAYRDISAGFAADFEFSRLRLLLFSAIIVHNFSETSLCYLNHPFWFLFLFSVMRPLPPPGVDGPAPARG